MPIIIKEDSKSLVDTLYSTKKVRCKTLRIIISSLQQYMREGTISEIKHVNSKDKNLILKLSFYQKPLVYITFLM